jgi:transcriptional regulator with XRE-family HTH domain
MVGEAEQKTRFSYALRRAMVERKMSARATALALKVDQRRVAGWLSGKTLPNLYESQALAHVLKVDEELFRNPPEVPPPPPEPYYPIERYLLEAGTAEGRRRATTRLDAQGPGMPALKPERRPHGSEAGSA